MSSERCRAPRRVQTRKAKMRGLAIKLSVRALENLLLPYLVKKSRKRGRKWSYSTSSLPQILVVGGPPAKGGKEEGWRHT
eukprot:768447-Hanusia_phi.AAC.3